MFVVETEHMAKLMDGEFNLFGIPFGWDAIMGLVPVAGEPAGRPSIPCEASRAIAACWKSFSESTFWHQFSDGAVRRRAHRGAF